MAREVVASGWLWKEGASFGEVLVGEEGLAVRAARPRADARAAAARGPDGRPEPGADASASARVCGVRMARE